MHSSLVYKLGARTMERNYMITKEDFITGDKFIGLADYTFSPEKYRDDEDYSGLVNTLNI